MKTEPKGLECVDSYVAAIEPLVLARCHCSHVETDVVLHARLAHFEGARLIFSSELLDNRDCERKISGAGLTLGARDVPAQLGIEQDCYRDMQN